MNGVLALVDEFVSGGRPRQIITANSLMLLTALRNSALRDVFRSADLVVPDSAGVLLAAWAKKKPFPEKICGIDLMERLCERAAEKGWRVYLLGAAPGVAEKAAQNLKTKFPRLAIAGTASGAFTPSNEEKTVQAVSQAAPDLLFVALDSPRQDIWIRKNLGRLGSKTVMGVGGSFDVLSGRLRRAPRWMRRAGLEWLFRLVQEPSRAKRMLGLPVFAIKSLSARKQRAP